MNNRNLIVVAVAAILIIAGGLYLYGSPVGSVANTGFEWQLTELDPHPATPEMPRTGVALLHRGAVFSAGEFDGSCFVIEDSEWELLENEESGVICWYAGGGKEIGVFNEGTLVAKVGDIEEGTAEEPGFRGNFNEIFKVELPK